MGESIDLAESRECRQRRQEWHAAAAQVSGGKQLELILHR